ncbi:MAG TPA: SBBP repeat-containing protein [Verrucomicrobiae bacterium]
MKLFPKRFIAASLALAAAALTVRAQTALNLGNLPLWFEAGHSQTGDTQFVARGRDSAFSISQDGAEIALRQPDGKTAAVRLSFVGAKSLPVISGAGELAGKINYFIGSDQTRWQSGLPTFGKVRLENIYPGVNVVYYGNQQRLEYDFDLAADVNPDTVAIHFDGADKVSVNSQGELVVELNGGKIIQHEPVAYQISAGVRHEVQAGYKLLDAHTVKFAIENYDHSLPLVIDPILSFSTFFGGNYGEAGWAIALDGDGDIFVAGQTLSTGVSNNVPFSTPNAAYPNFSGGSQLGDAFVAKFDNLGTNLLYCTYLGGSLDDIANALAVDAAGHAYVAGFTDSPNFPVKNPVAYGTFSGAAINGVVDHNVGHYPVDAFVSELDTNGASLIYSTYLGGAGADAANGIALDSAGDAFVTGFTYSANFPTTADALYPQLRCTNNFYVNANAFVAEIPAGGNGLNYSTYLGGSNYDVGTAIAFNNGNVLVAGYTISTSFPWTNGLAACQYLNGSNYLNSAAPDAFVTGFATAGTNLALLYSTFLGSSNSDQATGIAADAAGNAYVVGWTTSTNFPSTTSGLQISSFVHTNQLIYAAVTNAFLTQVKWNGAGNNVSLGYSQIFGGRGLDRANGVALDAAGNVFIVGSATSTNIPTTGGDLVGSLRATNSGASDVFVTVFKSDFSSLLYSTYLGGKADDFGYGIAVDAAGSAYITGQTVKTSSSNQTNFPAFNARQTVIDGVNDVFLAKILMASTPPLSAQPAGANILVTWPTVGQATPEFLTLETSTNLVSTNWTLISQVPVLTNGNYTLTFDPTNPAQFFRFHKF